MLTVKQKNNVYEAQYLAHCKLAEASGKAAKDMITKYGDSAIERYLDAKLASIESEETRVAVYGRVINITRALNKDTPLQLLTILMLCIEKLLNKE